MKTYKLKNSFYGLTCLHPFFIRDKNLVAVLPFVGEVIFPITIIEEHFFTDYFEINEKDICEECFEKNRHCSVCGKELNPTAHSR